MSDEADEVSAASRGSHGDTGIMSWEQADQIMQEQRAEIARLRLTDEERDALGEAIRLGDRWGWSETLRGLLERLGDK